MLEKPFNTIVTAIAHSPNLEANIFESIRIKNALGNKLILVHVGPKTDADNNLFLSIIKEAGGSNNDVEIVWREGDPVDVILELAKEIKADLLIAGALPREGLLRYYMGSIARRLVRAPDCHCSILLMTNPQKVKNNCSKIVVNGLDHLKTPETIKTAIKVASNLKAKELIIIEEVEPSKIGARAEDDLSLKKLNIAKKRIQGDEAKRIDSILNEVDKPENLSIIKKCIFGKKGYTIGHFAETSRADLLVMNNPDTKLGFLDRVFTHDLEYILSELPCNLLIIHSKRPN